MEHTQTWTHRLVRRSYWWAIVIALALLGTLLAWSDVLFIDLLLPFKGFGLATIWQAATYCKWGCLSGLVLFVAPQMGRQIYRNRNRAILAGVVWVLTMAALVGGFSLAREPIAQLLGNDQDHFSPISPDSSEWEEWSVYFDLESDEPSSAKTLVAHWQSGQIVATEIILLSLIGVGLVALAYKSGNAAPTMIIGSILYVLFVLLIGSGVLDLFIWDYDFFIIGSISGPLTVDLCYWYAAQSVYSRIGFPIYAVLAVSAWALDTFWRHAAARAPTITAQEPIRAARPAGTSALQDSRSSLLALMADHPIQLLGAMVVLVLMGVIWWPSRTPARSSTEDLTNAGQVAGPATVSKGSVNQVIYSPDGRLLAVGASQSLDLYDARTLAAVQMFDGGARSITFAPDGATLAVATYADRIELRQVADGRLLRTIDQSTFSITKLAFAPDGATLAGVREERVVQLWRVSDGRLLRTFKQERDIIHCITTTDIAFSPDGILLASATDYELRLWDVVTGEQYATINGQDTISSLAFAPNGRTIVAGVAHGGMREWRIRDGHRVVTLDFGEGEFVDSVAFAPNSDTVALGMRDLSVRLWRTEDPTMHLSIRVSRPHDPSMRVSSDDPGILSLAFAPDGSMLAAAWAGGVQVWRVSEGTPIGRLSGYQG